jgi:hypothetical protein
MRKSLFNFPSYSHHEWEFQGVTHSLQVHTHPYELEYVNQNSMSTSERLSTGQIWKLWGSSLSFFLELQCNADAHNTYTHSPI